MIVKGDNSLRVTCTINVHMPGRVLVRQNEFDSRRENDFVSFSESRPGLKLSIHWGAYLFLWGSDLD